MSSPAAAEPAKTRKTKEEALSIPQPQAGAGGNELLPLVSHTGLSTLWCCGQFRSHFPKNLPHPNPKICLLCQERPIFWKSTPKICPVQPRGVMPRVAEITALWTQGRPRISGFLPSTLMMYRDTEAGKYLQHRLELRSGWFWEASPLLPAGSAVPAVSHHGHIAMLEKHFQKEPK